MSKFTLEQKNKKAYSEHYNEWIVGDLYVSETGDYWIGKPNGVELIGGGKGMKYIKVKKETII